MITTFLNKNKIVSEVITQSNENLLKDAVWVDMLMPTKEEEKIVEKILGIEIPTREEMQEIELSSRLYKEGGNLYMTATMIAKSDSPNPKNDAVTLILTKSKLISIRYIESHSFNLFISRICKQPLENGHAVNLFIELLDVAVDRLADVLENISHRLENYSQIVFRQSDNNFSEKPDFKKHLKDIGANGDLTAKVQESLITFNRLITFFEQNIPSEFSNNNHSKLLTLIKDINSLSDYVSFLSNKVNFLLDATLGMVNIEQNNIIKIFSIAAVILLPPTLVASIYGMNFQHMPELSWRWGYPLAIFLMLIAGWLPYKFFKMKKWL